MLPFFGINMAYGQQQDYGIWSSVSAEKNISKKNEVSIEEGIRWNNNISNRENVFTQIGTKYKPSKSIRLGVGYRYSLKQSWEKQRNGEHRFQMDAQWKYKINKKFSFSNRVRFQSKIENYASSRYGRYPESYLRNKTELEAKINKKISTFYAFEFYHPLQYSSSFVDKNRHFIGIDIETSKDTKLQLFYLLETDYSKETLLYSHINGIEFKWNL